MQVEDSVSNNEAGDTENCWQRFQQRFNEIVRDVIRFAKFIPGFTELDLNDQILLLKGAGFEVTLVTSVVRNIHALSHINHKFLTTNEGISCGVFMFVFRFMVHNVLLCYA